MTWGQPCRQGGLAGKPCPKGTTVTTLNPSHASFWELEGGNCKPAAKEKRYQRLRNQWSHAEDADRELETRSGASVALQTRSGGFSMLRGKDCQGPSVPFFNLLYDSPRASGCTSTPCHQGSDEPAWQACFPPPDNSKDQDWQSDTSSPKEEHEEQIKEHKPRLTNTATLDFKVLSCLKIGSMARPLPTNNSNNNNTKYFIIILNS